MAKRKLDEVPGAIKKRRRSIISDKNTNPKDSEGLAECFQVVRAKMYVSVAPSYSQNVPEGIKECHLDPLVLKYDSALGGVVISHLNLRLLGQDAEGSHLPVSKIMNDSPFTYMWVQADFLVWCPRAGDTLEGYISVQSPGHIALLLHNTFNATVKRDDIPESWQFVQSQDDEVDSRSLGYWVDAHGNKVDGKLRFAVKYFNVNGRTTLVQGSLLTFQDVQLPTIPERVQGKKLKFTEADTEMGGMDDDTPQYAASEDDSSAEVSGQASVNGKEAAEIGKEKKIEKDEERALSHDRAPHRDRDSSDSSSDSSSGSSDSSGGDSSSDSSSGGSSASGQDSD